MKADQGPQGGLFLLVGEKFTGRRKFLRAVVVRLNGMRRPAYSHLFGLPFSFLLLSSDKSRN